MLSSGNFFLFLTAAIKMKKSYIIIGLMLFLAGCYYDREDDLYPAAGCDTTNITFNTTIKPMLESHCLNCHSNAAALLSGGNIKLETYTDIRTAVDDSSFYGSVVQNSKFIPMPKDGKLDDCSINMVHVWIKTGALNN
jgi:hypothetical protein